MSATKLAFSSLPAPTLATPSFLVDQEAEALERAAADKVRGRARLLFEQSGGAAGNDEANWLQAESEILGANMEIRESGTWLSLRAAIPDASGQGMQIAVKPTRVLVRATRTKNEQNAQHEGNEIADEIFLAASLPVVVDPLSAAASFRDHNLLLMIKKVQAGMALHRSDHLMDRAARAEHPIK
jgi:HSP20 family molecular chaperone IbpA